jgi:hypothetical protein
MPARVSLCADPVHSEGADCEQICSDFAGALVLSLEGPLVRLGRRGGSDVKLCTSSSATPTSPAPVVIPRNRDFGGDEDSSCNLRRGPIPSSGPRPTPANSSPPAVPSRASSRDHLFCSFTVRTPIIPAAWLLTQTALPQHNPRGLRGAASEIRGLLVLPQSSLVHSPLARESKSPSSAGRRSAIVCGLLCFAAYARRRNSNETSRYQEDF